MLLVLFFAMEHSDRIRVRGSVSRPFLRNVRQFMEAWRCICPDRYHIVDIVPDRAVELRPRLFKKPRAISAFSGGIDASFLAMRHSPASSEPWKYPLDTVLMIQGMDVWYDESDVFRRLVSRVEPFLKAQRLHRIEVRTDIRNKGGVGEFQSWIHSHAAQIIGIMHQLAPAFDYGLLGSSEPYNHMVVPWGSMPATDHLLGGELQVVHEGAGYSRTEKVALVADDLIASRTVKFCWSGPNGAVNCGRCEKCVRTRLNFLAVGKGDHPPCFEEPFSIDMLSAVKDATGIPLNELTTIAEFASQRGASGEWFTALAEIVSRQQAISRAVT